MPPTRQKARVPAAAKWLGAFGAVPFVFLALLSTLLAGNIREDVSFALAAYGAVILSFLGGVHWGLAISGQRSDGMVRRLLISVVPSLMGWLALILPEPIGLLVLAAAFALLLVVDLHASRRGEAPAWYPRLRWPLTSVVVLALAFGAVDWSPDFVNPAS